MFINPRLRFFFILFFGLLFLSIGIVVGQYDDIKEYAASFCDSCTAGLPKP